MATLSDILKAQSLYPIPAAALGGIAARRGLDLDAEADPDTVGSAAFTLARGDLYMWLAAAPNVSQGGQTYSFSDTQREKFVEIANSYYGLAGAAGDAASGTAYGYKGSRL